MPKNLDRKTVTLYTNHVEGYDPRTPSIWEKNTASSMDDGLFDDGEECRMFRDAYTWLYGLLGIERATWCLRRKVDWESDRQLYRYTLEVPSSAIIARVNAEVWSFVINGWTYCPEHLKFEKYNRDGSETKEFLDWEKKMGGREGVNRRYIFSKAKYIEYLIPNPVPDKWVVNVEKIRKNGRRS